MKKQLVTIMIAVAGSSALTSPTDAYTTFGRWSSNRINMRAASVSFAPGPWRNSLATCVSRFYNNPSMAYISMTYGDTSVGFNNGQSEIWFSSSSQYSPAVTFTWKNWWNGRIREADVVFWNGVPYTTSMNKTSLWPYGGSSRPFETTCLHELGHVGGLGHENDEYNIMGQDWDHIHVNGQTCKSYMGEDAADGLVALYGRASPASIEDVSVANFRWTGRSGAYSTHGLCRMFNSSGNLLSSSSFNGQRRYNVSRGQLVQVEFTWENNGETTQYPKAGFYISGNSTISTGDQRFATGSLTLARNSVYTQRTWLYIPWNLVRGRTYYLGAIVDYDNRIAEVDGQNATYHIIRVN